LKISDTVFIQQGDCLELMKKIPDKHIDMILCDLPYGTTACKWDMIIPFEPLWEQYERIIKNEGCIALFGSEPFSSKLRMSNSKLYKYDWIWVKSKASDFINANCRPMKKHEIISIFSFGKSSPPISDKNMKYFPQGIIYNDKKRIRKGTLGIGRDRKSQQGEYVSKGTNYPNSLLEFSNKGKTIHPTQKPVALLEYLIKTYTCENEIVLDNCAGSFSTGVACINTNRKFIGYELDEKYFEIGKNRLLDRLKEIS